jgi:hypothetical protein
MLMNHWIESTPSPKPSNAAIANSRDVLMKRLRAFKRERGRWPNLVAGGLLRRRRPDPGRARAERGHAGGGDPLNPRRYFPPRTKRTPMLAAQ